MKIKFELLMSLLIFVGCQKNLVAPLQKKSENVNIELIKAATNNIFDDLIKIRRSFHENPELAGKEQRTQKVIEEYLTKLGIEVKTGIYGYGVVGILKGDQKGKKIAWRAEMDALPNDFPDDVDFKSKVKGIQHGCGHDVHMAIALGIAEILSKNKKSLKGTVYFIFQPEEETFIGAKKMIENGLFSDIRPDEIYGLHVTDLPYGQIMVKPNEMFAYQKRVRITMKNNLSNEETKELTGKVFNSLSRFEKGSKPWDILQINDPKIGLSNPNTIFKDYLIMNENFATYSKGSELFLESDLYETNKSNLSKIIPKIEAVIETNGYKNKFLSISFVQENPTVNNDKKLTQNAINILNKNKKNRVTYDYGQVPYFNDDFTYFQQKIPGVYFLLGGSNTQKGIVAMNHTPNFSVDEECIRTSVQDFSSLILERLDEK